MINGAKKVGSVLAKCPAGCARRWEAPGRGKAAKMPTHSTEIDRGAEVSLKFPAVRRGDGAIMDGAMLRFDLLAPCTDRTGGSFGESTKNKNCERCKF